MRHSYVEILEYALAEMHTHFFMNLENTRQGPERLLVASAVVPYHIIWEITSGYI